jgi:predicted Rossmann-fold nucleotide-binding protein
VVILNINHYYDSLLALLKLGQEEQFIPDVQDLWSVAVTAQEAVDLATIHPDDSN